MNVAPPTAPTAVSLAFVDAFQPERGDLLYGLRDTRTEYLKRWEAKTQADDLQRLVEFLTMTASGGKANWNIIDNFNDYFFLGGNVDFNPLTGSKSKGLAQLYGRMQDIEKTLGGNAGKKADQVLQRAAYVEGIKGSRFSPLSAFDASKDKLAKEGFRPASSGGSKTQREAAATDQNRAYLAIRRACKFGIGLAATSAAFAGGTVHFLLDGLDMAEVAEKRERTGYGGRKSVSITTSELRYVFRNWGKLSGTVRFYVNLQKVDAPWDQDWSLPTLGGMPPNPIKAERALWAQYAQDRSAKYGGAVPAKPLI